MFRVGTEALPLLGRHLLRQSTRNIHCVCLPACSDCRWATGRDLRNDSVTRRRDDTLIVISRAGFSKSVEPPNNGDEGKTSSVHLNGKFTGPKKFHKRTLTEDEKREDQKLRDVFAAVEADDLFGTLSSAKSSKAKETNGDKHKLGNYAAPSSRERKFDKSRNNRWADTFGTLSNKNNSLLEQIEESRLSQLGTGNERVLTQASGEGEEETNEKPHIRLSATNRRHPPQWYGRQIQKLGREGQVDKAVEVLERWMLKEDRVLPDFFVFSNLLAVLGRAGRAKQAYKIFNMMKKMGVRPNNHAYTAVFNACGNSPDLAVGHDTAQRLQQTMLDQDVQPNLITSKAMMKAFGVCGDLETTFALADGIAQRRELDAECISFLLMACIADKENGFRLALQVWRKMLDCKVRPDLPLYNLLVRAVRECGVGDIQSITELLPDCHQQTVADPPQTNSLGSNPSTGGPQVLETGSPGMVLHPLEVAEVTSDKTRQARPEDLPPDGKSITSEECLNEKINTSLDQESAESSPTSKPLGKQETGPASHRRWWEDESDDEQLSSLQRVSLDETTVLPLTNILTQNTVFDAAAPISIFREASGRLALLGGKEGLLRQMGGDRVAPDIRTFDLLLSCLPETCQAEEETLVLMEQHSIKPDIDFLNMVIFRRCKRRQFREAKGVLPMIVKAQLFPNLRTFQYLAMTCVRQQDGMQLLADMESAGFSPSIETLGTLVFASGMDFAYKQTLLEKCEELGLPPNVKLLENVEKSLALARRRIVQAEKEGGRRGQYFLSPEFQESFRKFNFFYSKWLKDKNFT